MHYAIYHLVMTEQRMEGNEETGFSINLLRLYLIKGLTVPLFGI
jgi:hypothetical protein